VATTPLIVGVRPATPHDLDAIADMWVQMIDHHEQIDARIWKRADDGRQTFRGYVADSLSRDDRRVLVAEADGRAVGFLMGLITGNHPPLVKRTWGAIGDAFVLPALRRRGIGRRLVEAAIEWFTEKHVDGVKLSAAIANDAGSAFWQAMGFEPYMTQFLRPGDPHSGRGEP
jgi:ribosomal protein S18 acetylase RimI-like enzyme